MPGTPSIRTITPDPDSSVGLVLPGAGGLTASTETTLGAIWRMTASNRSPSWVGEQSGCARRRRRRAADWATTRVGPVEQEGSGEPAAERATAKEDGLDESVHRRFRG